MIRFRKVFKLFPMFMNVWESKIQLRCLSKDPKDNLATKLKARLYFYFSCQNYKGRGCFSVQIESQDVGNLIYCNFRRVLTFYMNIFIFKTNKYCGVKKLRGSNSDSFKKDCLGFCNCWRKFLK